MPPKSLAKATHELIKKRKHIPMSFFESLNIKTAGLTNKEIQNKLNPYVPIIEVILKISK